MQCTQPDFNVPSIVEINTSFVLFQIKLKSKANKFKLLVKGHSYENYNPNTDGSILAIIFYILSVSSG